MIRRGKGRIHLVFMFSEKTRIRANKRACLSLFIAYKEETIIEFILNEEMDDEKNTFSVGQCILYGGMFHV